MRRFRSIQAGRGYTLVEMGITIVVIGLLLGGILMPLGERFRTEQYEQVRADLDAIKEALVAYAAASSAPGFSWVHWSGTRTVYSEGRLPPGRRFLPCPDLDGDGIEDRIGRVGNTSSLSTSNEARTEAFFSHLGDFGVGSTEIDETELAVAVVTVTIGGVATTIDLLVRNPVSLLTIGSTNPVRAGAGTNASRREVLAFEEDDPPDQLNLGSAASYGHCASDSGAVPWATLGAPSADPWGNRYIYRVDPYFAHSLLGFGPESRADAFDPTRALVDPTTNIVRNKLYAYRSADDQTEDVRIDNLYEYRRRDDSGDTYQFSTSRNSMTSSKLPGLICLDGAVGCSWDAVASITVGIDRATSYLGEVAEGTRAMVIWDTFGGIQAQREYDLGDPIDGMAFVVLSTGRNRAGGIPSTNLADISPPNSGNGLISNCLDPGPGSEAERVNMPRHACNVPSPPIGSGEESYNFNLLPRAAGIGFDDELTYMGGRELIGRLAADGVDLGPIWIPPGKRI